jgi:hypothetical protein
MLSDVATADIVWRFQNRFGVEKVKVVEECRGKTFSAVECSSPKDADKRIRRINSDSSLTDKKSSEDDDSVSISTTIAFEKARPFFARKSTTDQKICAMALPNELPISLLKSYDSYQQNLVLLLL